MGGITRSNQQIGHGDAHDTRIIGGMGPGPVERELQTLIHGGHAEEALERATAQLIAAEASDDHAAMVTLLAAVAMAHEYAGRPRESLLALYRAIDLLETSEQLSVEERRATTAWLCSLAATDLAVLGEVSHALGMLTKAQRFVFDAEVEPNGALLMRILNNVAVTHHRFGQHELAIEAIDHAILLAERVDEPYLALHSRANRVIYRLLQARDALRSDPVLAHALATETLAEARELEAVAQIGGWPHVIGMMYREVGPLLVASGDPERARGLLRVCLTQAVETGRSREAVALSVRLATVERLAGQQDEATRILDSVADSAAGLDPELRLEYYAELSEVLAAEGNYQQSLAAFREYHDLQVTRLRTHGEARAQALAARFGAEQARLRAAVLEDRTRDLERNAGELERSVESLQSQAQRLADQALHDPLTGIGNRRYLELHIAELHEQPSVELCVLFLDLDHFKHINDAFGHAVGDRTLVQVAALLSTALRPQDRLCRFGGEEFLLLVPDVNVSNAVVIAERLRRLINDFDWSGISEGLQVTCSIGLADGPASAVHGLVFAADAGLRQAKEGGRNRVCVGSVAADAASGMSGQEGWHGSAPRPRGGGADPVLRPVAAGVSFRR